MAMESYIGNMHSICAKEASVHDLWLGTLTNVARMVSNAIKEANEEHFRDLVDWVQCHDEEVMLHNVHLGFGSPPILISASPHLSLKRGFGFG